MTPNNGQWLRFIDFLRAYAAFMVVMAHVSGDVAVAFGRVAAREWWIANLIHIFSRVSLPLFVMASGCVILRSSKTDRFGHFLKRRALRVLLPFAAWFGLYTWLTHVFQGVPVSIRSMVVGVLSGHPFVQLYFLLLIMGLYTVAPLLRMYVAHAEAYQRRLYVGILLALASAGSLINYFIGTQHNSLCGIPFNVATLWFPFVGYFLAGYHLGLAEVTPKAVRLAMLIFVSCLGAATVATYVSFVHYGATEHGFYFYTFLSPPFLGMTLSAFILIKALHTGVPRPGWRRVARNVISRAVAPATFGIYLAHPLVLFMLGKLGIRSGETTVYLSIPAVTVLTFVGSLLLSLCMLRVPGLRRLV